jgi:uncharacterized membrane protein (DUF106 family)
MKDILSKFALIVGAIFFVGIIFSKEFRIALGLLIDPLMQPLAPLPFYITILILSIVTATYSNLIQKYTVDFKKVKYAQEVIRKYQKEYMEATKQNNQFKLKELEKRKDEIQKLQSEVMSMQFKPMFYTGLVTIPIFAWLWEKVVSSYEVLYGTLQTSSAYGGNITHDLPPSFLSSINPDLFFVNIPFVGEIHMSTGVFIFPWWLWWYLFNSITFGQIIKKIMKVGV